MHAINPMGPLVPFCVDLDGTLVCTDMLHESALELFKTSPASLFYFLPWLLRGKATLKYRIAERVELNVSCLPYRQEVLSLIDEARAQGRMVVLTTASAPQIAMAVANHLGVFDRVISSDEQTNLCAEFKSAELVKHYGEGAFDYIGNSYDDLPVWARARRVLVVSNDRRLLKSAAAGGQLVEHIANRSGQLQSWLHCIRPHQWLKNLLVFVPLVAGHKSTEASLLMSSILAFFAFSFAASFGYLVNDLLDLNADRQHARKCKRPFAAGDLPISRGVLFALLLVLASAAFSVMLPPLFIAVIGIYLVLTLSYSLRLKKQVVVDVVLLAGLYTLRIIAGATAVEIVPSFWLLAFSMFIFLSLAIVKRYSELRLNVNENSVLAGRGYMAADLPALMALGAGSGLMSVMVIALYIDSSIVTATYSEPLWLWMIPPTLLYWVTRLWLKTNRGEVHDDPVIFAARDKQSLSIAALIGCSFIAAQSGIRFW